MFDASNTPTHTVELKIQTKNVGGTYVDSLPYKIVKTLFSSNQVMEIAGFTNIQTVITNL